MLKKEMIKKIKKTPTLQTLILFAAVTLIVSLVLGTIALARYVGDKKTAKLQAADAFCFTSNLLKEDGETYTVNGTSASFILLNSADNLRFTIPDIAYTIEKSGSGEAVLSSTSGVLAGGGVNTETINITAASGTVTITAESTSPYTEELSATFVFTGTTSENTYEIIDYAGSYTAELIVYANSDIAANTIAVNWSAGITPDSTSTFFGLVNPVSGAKNASSMSEKSSTSILLFKSDPLKNYTKVRTIIPSNNIILPNL